MTGGYDTILTNLRDYSGSGLLFLLLVVSIVFLSIRYRQKSGKVMFAVYPVVMLLVYFCPIWIIYISKRNDADILYRLLWLIPVGVVICAALIEFIFLLPDNKRFLGVISAILLIMMSGKYLYINPQFSPAENIHHIPGEVVEICDLIEVPGREIQACFPDEMLQYVRQYNPYIFMPYGRDVFFEGFMKPDTPLRDLLLEECLDGEAVANELRMEYTSYLIVSKEKEFSPKLTEFEFDKIGSVGDYDIYLDLRANITLSNKQ